MKCPCGGDTSVIRTVKTAKVEIRDRQCDRCQDRWETGEKETKGTRTTLAQRQERHRAAISSSPVAVPAQSGRNPVRSEQLSSLNLISDLSLPESDPSKPLDLVKPPAREPETVRLFEVIGGAAWGLPKALHEQWRKAYPAVDVATEYEKIAAWLASNPANRKTPRGMSAFVNRWLGRAQDSARPTAITRAPSFRTTQEIQTDAARRFLDRHPEEAAK